MDIETIHNQASDAASTATKTFLTKYGDGFPCGFAWVTVSERGNTRLGKALKSVGFDKAYGGGLQLWNPSKMFTQSVDALEAGARAYADVLKSYGINASVGSRLD